MRITVPTDQIAVLLPSDLAQELYSLCSTIRKTKRLQITPAIHNIAGDVMLHLLASEQILVIPKREENND